MIATPARSRREQIATSSSHTSRLTELLPNGRDGFAGHEPLPLRAGLRSVTGLYRKRNEDRCVANESSGVFLVTDGVGGHRGGAEASEILTCVLSSWLSQTAKCAWRDIDLIESAVTDAVETARRTMIDLAELEPDFRQMAATMALAMLVDRKLYVTHVGDCRAYLLHDGVLRRLTTDQTFVQAAITAGLLTEEAARHHVWRHVVTNSVGVAPLDEPICVEEFELAPGDRVLLCSDGLTDVVTDAELEQLLQQRCCARTTANLLVDVALENDSHDNVTCVVVDCGSVS